MDAFRVIPNGDEDLSSSVGANTEHIKELWGVYLDQCLDHQLEVLCCLIKEQPPFCQVFECVPVRFRRDRKPAGAKASAVTRQFDLN